MEVEATISIAINNLKLVDGVLKLTTEEATELKDKLVEILPKTFVPPFPNYPNFPNDFEGVPPPSCGGSLQVNRDEQIG